MNICIFEVLWSKSIIHKFKVGGIECCSPFQSGNKIKLHFELDPLYMETTHPPSQLLFFFFILLISISSHTLYIPFYIAFKILIIELDFHLKYCPSKYSSMHLNNIYFLFQLVFNDHRIELVYNIKPMEFQTKNYSNWILAQICNFSAKFCFFNLLLKLISFWVIFMRFFFR